MARRLLLAVVAVVIAAGVAFAATGRDRADAIYPSQRIPLNFSHAVHVKPESAGGQGIACEACHEPAPDSVKASDDLLPRAGPARPDKGYPEHEKCEGCHDIEHGSKPLPVGEAPGKCEACHIGYEKTRKVLATSFPTPNLIFNHKVHFEKLKDIKCETCHFGTTGAGMEEVDLSTRYQLPKMKTCLECHNGATAPAECKTCHLTDPSGRLQVVFSGTVLKPMQGDPLGLDHGPRFEFTHGTRAKIDRKACAECHTDGYCATCHDSLQKPLSVHPNDFITLHPVQARMDSLQCDSCHRFQSFCAACHERVGIGMSADPTLRARNLSVHGLGDAAKYAEFVTVGGPNHHAVAAARDLKSCMSCHREESCLKCHQAPSQAAPGQRVVNPHGPGFTGRCRALRQANDRGCLKCHTAADLDARGCR